MADWTVGASGADFTTIKNAYASGSVSGGDRLLLFDEEHNSGSAGAISSAKALTLEADSGAEHDGGSSWTSGARIVWDDGSQIWYNPSLGTKCRSLLITANSGNYVMLVDSGGSVSMEFERCKIRGSGIDLCRYTTGKPLSFKNCVITGFGGTRGLCRSASGMTVTLHHTIIRQSIAFNWEGNSVTLDIRGCAFSGSVTTNAGSTTNVYDSVFSAASPGNLDVDSNNNFSVTFTTSTGASAAIYTDLTAGAEDFTPVDHANNILLGNATAGVTEEDIVGASRSEASDDIGPFELVAGGISGTSNFAFPIFSMAAGGTVGHPGTSAFTFPVFQMSAGGIVGRVGTSSFTFPIFQMSGAGAVGHPGTSNFAFPVFAMAGSGTVGGGATGTSNFTFPVFTMAGSGGVGHVGTAAFTFPVFEMLGSSGKSGTAEFVFPVFKFAGTNLPSYGKALPPSLLRLRGPRRGYR